MREILFRGKYKYGDGWVYGFLYTEKTSAFIVEDLFCVDDMFYTGAKNTEVIPESVGEYTGICDKNGAKIFEGDIISIPFEEDRSPWEENCIYYENGEVYFCAEHHGWYVRFYDDETLSLWEYDDLDIEVIGNIHDSPELLKD